MNPIDDLDSVMENKLKENLKWSMLFFIFKMVCSNLQNKQDSSRDNKNVIKDFFKNWKKHTCDHMVKKDLETINSILNSPKNIFYSILKNSDEDIESTELYQEKYNNTIKKIEDFYFNNLNIKNNDD